MAEIQGLLVRLEATTSLLRGELAKADRAVADTAAKAERNAQRAERALSGIGTTLRGALAGFSLAAVGRDIVQTTFQFEKLDSRLRNLSGGAQAFAENQKYISEAANRMGLDIVTATTSFSGLLALQQSGKLTMDQTKQIFEGMADVAATFGTSSEQLKLSFFGLNQALGSATVTMEDVRQVTDPIPMLFENIAKAGGRTSGELRQMISDGKVTADVFSRLLIAALQQYQGAAEKAAGGLNGTWTQLQNSWIELKRTLEQPITDTLTPLMNSAITALKQWQVSQEGFKPMEERGPARLRYDLDRAREGRARAEFRNKERGGTEDLSYYDKLIGQIEARLAFLEGPPAGAGPAPPAAAPPPVLPPPPPPKKTLTDAERAGARADERFRDTLAGLRHEADQLGRTAEQQELYNALKQAGVALDSERGRQIAAVVAGMQAERTNREELQKAADAENKVREEGRRITESLRGPQEAYNARIKELRALLAAGAIDQRTFTRAVVEAGAEMHAATQRLNRLGPDMQFLSDVGTQAFDRIGSSITEALTQGEKSMVSLRSVGLGVVSELSQAFWQLAVSNPLRNLVTGGNGSTLVSVFGSAAQALGNWWAGGGLTGSNFALGTPTGYVPAGAPGRAGGGPVSAGQPYVVGERQPELFVPSVNGRILPRLPTVAGPPSAAAGDTLQLVQHFNVTTGVQSTVRAEIQSLMPQIAAQSRAALLDAQARRGRSL